ncbi:MAG: NusG domain II-containing protein [Lachnospiraceae bacterium]|nr:NusG domain II-containing protein [Lachnospiraceae bacterium]
MLKRNDVLLVLGILLTVVILYIVRGLVMSGASSDYIEVRLDGKLIAEYSLDEDREEVIYAPDGGYNILTIRDGKVAVKEADCPDKHCVNKGFVSGQNETIICLPNRLVIKLCVDSDKTGITPDVMAQ